MSAPKPLPQHPGEPIRFFLNGQLQVVHDVAPTTTLLNWLRAHGHTGSKEGCAEGDCGACTVVIAKIHAGQLQMKAVNACIKFLPSVDAQAVFTVEYLKQAQDPLHPVQQAMVDTHASQCGFCTPGFVMALWGLYLEEPEPNTSQICTALSGNLCRCTGYKPIIQAGLTMGQYPRAAFDREALKTQLLTLQRSQTFTYTCVRHGVQERFDAPRSLTALTQLRANYPQATLLAGATDVGLWVTKHLRALPHVIDLTEVAELQHIRVQGDQLAIGAGVNLNAAFAALCQHYPHLQAIGARFASTPIRNTGTLGGNVANGSPIGDSMPALMALGTAVELCSSQGARRVLLEDFYVAYQKKAWQADEVLSQLFVPLPQAGLHLRSYKVAKRYDSDISAVCGAFALILDADRVRSCRVAYGGMAATVRRAAQTEAALCAQPWNEQTVRLAMQALAADFQPLSDMRASSAYRLRVAQNMLYRFYLETRRDAPLHAAHISVFPSEELRA